MREGDGLPEQVGDLAEELTTVRRRGLDDIDVEDRRQARVAVPILEQLARDYARDEQRARIGLIRDLLDSALVDWDRQGHAGEARLVRRLFFADNGGTPGQARPRALLDSARSESGLSDEQFDVRRRAVFRLFARFLLDYVASQPAEGLPLAEGTEQVESRVMQARPTRRWRWVGAAIALAVAGAVLWLLLLGPTGESPDGPAARSSTPSGSGAATFTFDALSGGSSTINVYPGVEETPEDRIANGTFDDGQSVTALCKEK